MTYLSDGTATGTGLGRLGVIIIDPSRNMRSILKGILRAFGVRNIREADNPADAFKEMKAFPVDIVFTELKLEPIDGVELIKMLRTAPDTPDPYIPVVVVSGHTERQWVERARDAGLTEFLAKPLSPEAVYSRLHAIINHQRPFVRTGHYFGPDRRRKKIRYEGDNRRITDAAEANADPPQPQKSFGGHKVTTSPAAAPDGSV